MITAAALTFLCLRAPWMPGLHRRTQPRVYEGVRRAATYRSDLHVLAGHRTGCAEPALQQRLELCCTGLAQVDDSTGSLPGVSLEMAAAPARTELSSGPRRRWH